MIDWVNGLIRLIIYDLKGDSGVSKSGMLACNEMAELLLANNLILEISPAIENNFQLKIFSFIPNYPVPTSTTEERRVKRKSFPSTIPSSQDHLALFNEKRGEFPWTTFSVCFTS